ncbi:MAG: hypothetical protein J6I38_00325 [Prevotella sp.]|nr:hypothetical protein [Prevotella sp.]
MEQKKIDKDMFDKLEKVKQEQLFALKPLKFAVNEICSCLAAKHEVAAFTLIFLQSYTIASNCFIASLLGVVYLFAKVTLPTLSAKQLVLVPLRWPFWFVNPTLLIPKQVVLVSRRLSPE